MTIVLASWQAADEATRIFLQAHLWHDVVWAMPGRDELGRPWGSTSARIVGVNVRDKVVVFREIGRRNACFVWSFREAAFEWLEGRLVMGPKAGSLVLVRGDDDEPLAVACLECGGFALDTVSKRCVECGWRSRVAR